MFGTDAAVNPQDNYPWNSEIMSIMCGYQKTKIGNCITNAVTKKIKLHWRCEHEQLRGMHLKLFTINNKLQSFRFYKQIAKKDEVDIRILALKKGFSVQFLNGFCFSERDLGDCRTVTIDGTYAVLQ